MLSFPRSIIRIVTKAHRKVMSNDLELEKPDRWETSHDAPIATT